MTKREIEALLGDTRAWAVAGEQERMAFASCMRLHQYGFDALQDAFLWFDAGWRSACRHIEA